MPTCSNPACGHPVPPDTKFCPQCGSKVVLPPQSPTGKPAGSPITIGEKAVVGGDVIGSKHEVKVLGGSYTSITHSDETKKVRLCAVCHSNREIVQGYDCPACNLWVCSNCFVVASRACVKCDNSRQGQAKANYRSKLAEVYEDYRVDETERAELRIEADRLGISPEDAQKLEAPFRETRESALSGGELVRLRAAEVQLYQELKVDEAFRNLQPLYEQYQRRDSRLWRVYLNCLTEQDPELALTLIDGLDVDDECAASHRVLLLARQHDYVRASRAVKEARVKFGASARWDAIEAEVMLDEYRQLKEKLFLDEALKLLAGTTEEDPTTALPRAYHKVLSGQRDAFKQLLDCTPPGSEEAYRITLKQKWMTLGPLRLVLNGREYVCKSGDVIGREGTVAMDQLAKIKTLSRRHAQVMVRCGRWYLRVLNATNTSYLDSRQLGANEFYPLALEHRVRLSTQCEFELKLTIGL